MLLLQRSKQIITSTPWISRPICTATTIHHHLLDEGDWFYASEWWGTDSPTQNTVFRSTSDRGNGVVSVVAHPCSRPIADQWKATEIWLQKRYEDIHSENLQNEHFTILGYQWRTLRFNDFTRQSTVKIMAAYRQSDPSSIFFMQQPHILAVPYLKSMISVGLATIASSNFNFMNAVHGEKPLRVLCIGHGGGSLPLFLASKIHGAIVHIVEIDPLVISTSIQAMGFPRFAMARPSGERAFSLPETMDKVFWRGTHERLFLYESDAEKFILDSENTYDLVFIDAYDGDDIFPRSLWDPNGPFLEALKTHLHPHHGTVVVNLHADADADADMEDSNANVQSNHLLSMGKYVSQVCRAYKDVLVGSESDKGGVAFKVAVPWLCNTSLVVSRGYGVGDGKLLNRDLVLETLVSKSREVKDVLNLPFSCLQYIKSGFVLAF
ncbi:hypothetical protein GIB67_009072 [Kingdonia uniflora]|uniref:S-adenosyl-L-methionine-dependent methyltransferase n=1 Tax=Kingdonia uniflora TaxID=39325 RepID=A0A7J7MNL1_9MAGN|nr:hypothetical protein GIB67_009072 [Kingdonia uniflora]